MNYNKIIDWLNDQSRLCKYGRLNNFEPYNFTYGHVWNNRGLAGTRQIECIKYQFNSVWGTIPLSLITEKFPYKTIKNNIILEEDNIEHRSGLDISDILYWSCKDNMLKTDVLMSNNDLDFHTICSVRSTGNIHTLLKQVNRWLNR